MLFYNNASETFSEIWKQIFKEKINKMWQLKKLGSKISWKMGQEKRKQTAKNRQMEPTWKGGPRRKREHVSCVVLPQVVSHVQMRAQPQTENYISN